MFNKIVLGLVAAALLLPSVASAQWSFQKRNTKVGYSFSDEPDSVEIAHRFHYGISTAWYPEGVDVEFSLAMQVGVEEDEEGSWWLNLDGDSEEAMMANSFVNVYLDAGTEFDGDLLEMLFEDEFFTGQVRVRAVIRDHADPFGDILDIIDSYYVAPETTPTSKSLTLESWGRTVTHLVADFLWEDDGVGIVGVTIELQQWNGSAWVDTITPIEVGNTNAGRHQIDAAIISFQGGSFRYRYRWDDTMPHWSDWTTFSAPDPSI